MEVLDVSIADGEMVQMKAWFGEAATPTGTREGKYANKHS